MCVYIYMYLYVVYTIIILYYIYIYTFFLILLMWLISLILLILLLYIYICMYIYMYVYIYIYICTHVRASMYLDQLLRLSDAFQATVRAKRRPGTTTRPPPAMPSKAEAKKASSRSVRNVVRCSNVARGSRIIKPLGLWFFLCAGLLNLKKTYEVKTHTQRHAYNCKKSSARRKKARWDEVAWYSCWWISLLHGVTSCYSCQVNLWFWRNV